MPGLGVSQEVLEIKVGWLYAENEEGHEMI